MKVCRFPRNHDIDALELFDEAKPSPGPRWIAVRMRAVSLNYRDLNVAAGPAAITRLSNPSSHGRRASGARSGNRSSGTK
jgi:NADPH:quinone reductase-like Zn-dependent oxidoreductase